jgi:hypothetical protein
VAGRDLAERIDGRPTVEASTPSHVVEMLPGLEARAWAALHSMRYIAITDHGRGRLARSPARCAVLTVSLPSPAADGRP